jgi:serine/threonine protein kinase
MAEAALQELPGDQHASPKYQLIKALGRGSFGFVCLCHNTQTQELSAIKFLPRAEVRAGRAGLVADLLASSQLRPVS